jgi:hypothetical protein
MACDELVMPANTSLWVHDPAAWLDAWGYQNAKELRDTAQKVLNLADDLDTTREQLVGTYLAKAEEKISRDELVALMEREITITAEQAVVWGLADRIEEPLQQAACHDMGEMRDAAHAAFRARVEKAGQGTQPPEDYRVLAIQPSMDVEQIQAAVNRVPEASGIEPVDLFRPAPPIDARALATR